MIISRLPNDHTSRRRQSHHRNAVRPRAHEYGLVRTDTHPVCVCYRGLAGWVGKEVRADYAEMVWMEDEERACVESMRGHCQEMY